MDLMDTGQHPKESPESTASSSDCRGGSTTTGACTLPAPLAGFPGPSSSNFSFDVKRRGVGLANVIEDVGRNELKEGGENTKSYELNGLDTGEGGAVLRPPHWQPLPRTSHKTLQELEQEYQALQIVLARKTLPKEPKSQKPRPPKPRHTFHQISFRQNSDRGTLVVDRVEGREQRTQFSTLPVHSSAQPDRTQRRPSLDSVPLPILSQISPQESAEQLVTQADLPPPPELQYSPRSPQESDVHPLEHPLPDDTRATQALVTEDVALPDYPLPPIQAEVIPGPIPNSPLAPNVNKTLITRLLVSLVDQQKQIDSIQPQTGVIPQEDQITQFRKQLRAHRKKLKPSTSPLMRLQHREIALQRQQRRQLEGITQREQKERTKQKEQKEQKEKKGQKEQKEQQQEGIREAKENAQKRAEGPQFEQQAEPEAEVEGPVVSKGPNAEVEMTDLSLEAPTLKPDWEILQEKILTEQRQAFEIRYTDIESGGEQMDDEVQVTREAKSGSVSQHKVNRQPIFEGSNLEVEREMFNLEQMSPKKRKMRSGPPDEVAFFDYQDGPEPPIIRQRKRSRNSVSFEEYENRVGFHPRLPIYFKNITEEFAKHNEREEKVAREKPTTETTTTTTTTDDKKQTEPKKTQHQLAHHQHLEHLEHPGPQLESHPESHPESRLEPTTRPPQPDKLTYIRNQLQLLQQQLEEEQQLAAQGSMDFEGEATGGDTHSREAIQLLQQLQQLQKQVPPPQKTQHTPQQTHQQQTHQQQTNQQQTHQHMKHNNRLDAEGFHGFPHGGGQFSPRLSDEQIREQQRRQILETQRLQQQSAQQQHLQYLHKQQQSIELLQQQQHDQHQHQQRLQSLELLRQHQQLHQHHEHQHQHQHHHQHQHPHHEQHPHRAQHQQHQHQQHQQLAFQKQQQPHYEEERHQARAGSRIEEYQQLIQQQQLIQHKQDFKQLEQQTTRQLEQQLFRQIERRQQTVPLHMQKSTYTPETEEIFFGFEPTYAPLEPEIDIIKLLEQHRTQEAQLIQSQNTQLARIQQHHKLMQQELFLRQQLPQLQINYQKHEIELANLREKFRKEISNLRADQEQEVREVQEKILQTKKMAAQQKHRLKQSGQSGSHQQHLLWQVNNNKPTTRDKESEEVIPDRETNSTTNAESRNPKPVYILKSTPPPTEDTTKSK